MAIIQKNLSDRCPKHIALYISNLLLGGAEKSTLKLAGGLASRGYLVDLVLVNAKGQFVSDIPTSVRVINLYSPSALVGLPRFIRYLRQESPDVIISAMYLNIVALWAKRLACIAAKNVFIERTLLSGINRQYPLNLRNNIILYLSKIYYPQADKIIAISNGVAEDLVKVIGVSRDQIQVIYNPTISPDFIERADAELSHPWFYGMQPPVILGVGRLSPEKDFASLIKAFYLVQKERSARLLILGEGGERKKLENLINNLGIEEKVSLPGYTENPYPYMRYANLFVLTSEWEGLGGVLIEALYCGIPIIATNCPGGVKEVLADGQYGTLVPVGNPDKLAHTINEYLDGNFVRPPKESWKRFELEHVVDEYIQAIF